MLHAGMPVAAQLHVIGGNDRGKRYDLTLAETRIGRGADQDVVLTDIAVSRRHVTVHMEGARFRIRDLGSGNGTLVNGQRVDSHVLADGDHIEIGQTVMRFEHAASRAQPAAAPPAPARTAPPPPSYGAPSMPTETPSDMVVAPLAMPAPLAGPATGQRPNPIGFLRLETALGRGLVFGGMGLLSIIFLLVILSRTVWAKPQVVPSEAEELYKQGLRLFAAADYEGARISFNEAQSQAPDAPDPKRYLKQCDLELRARAAMKAAERALSNHRYLEALKALDEIDSASLMHDDAARLRRENAIRAAAEAVDEAKRLASDDPETARRRVQQALELDRTSADARALEAQLRAGKVASVTPPPPAPAPEPADKPEHVAAIDKHDRHHHADKDPELAPIKVPPQTRPTPVASGGSGGLSAAGLALYRNRDFAGAEKLTRQESVNQPQKQFQRSIDAAGQLKQLKTIVDRAGSEEAQKPDAAIRDYDEALAIDGKIGHGALGGYFKQKIAKLQIAYAQQAFAKGQFEVAYSAAKEAQRSGSDGGMLKQLENKAAELVQKGQSVQKSNVNQAKVYWRQVLRMVPQTSPTYAKAYQLLNNSVGQHRDVDED